MKCPGNPEHEGVFREPREDRNGVWCAVCNLWICWEYPPIKLDGKFRELMREFIREIVKDELKARE